MARDIVKATNLSKQYDSVTAIDNLSFSYSHGINGLLGSNGAGKTTLISLILGRVKPSSGTLTVLGYSPYSHRTKVSEEVGWVPEQDYFNIDVSTEDFLCHIGELAGLKRVSAMKRVSKLSSILEMGEEIHRSLDTLSYGMKQKVKVIGALIHDPSLLLMDEPLHGLDPPSQEKMLDLIQKIAKNMGKDIIIATHLLDVAEITDRILVIEEGKKVGEKDAMEKLERQKKIRFQVRKSIEDDGIHFLDILKSHGFRPQFDASSGFFNLPIPPEKDVSSVKNTLLQLIVKHSFQLQAFMTTSPDKTYNLENLFEREDEYKSN